MVKLIDLARSNCAMLPGSMQEINEEEGVVLVSLNSVMRIIYSYFGVILFLSLVIFALDLVADFLESDNFAEIEEIATFISQLIRTLSYGIVGTVGIAILIKLFADTWGSMAYNKALNQEAALSHSRNSQPSSTEESNEITNTSEVSTSASRPHSSSPSVPPSRPAGPPAPPTQHGYQNSQAESVGFDVPSPPQSNSRKKLFDLITSQGHSIGEFSFFEERMTTDEGRRLFFNHAVQNNMPVGSWESFEQKMKQ